MHDVATVHFDGPRRTVESLGRLSSRLAGEDMSQYDLFCRRQSRAPIRLFQKYFRLRAQPLRIDRSFETIVHPRFDGLNRGGDVGVIDESDFWYSDNHGLRVAKQLKKLVLPSFETHHQHVTESAMECLPTPSPRIEVFRQHTRAFQAGVQVNSFRP